jgi:hypothetical protein
MENKVIEHRGKIAAVVIAVSSAALCFLAVVLAMG